MALITSGCGCAGVIDRLSLEHINMDIPRTAAVHRRFELVSHRSATKEMTCR